MRTSYIWLFAIPLLATVFVSIGSTAHITIFGHTWSFATELPFSWKILYASAVLFSAATLTFQIFCPALVARYPTYSKFRENGQSSYVLTEIFYDRIGYSRSKVENFDPEESLFFRIQHYYRLCYGRSLQGDTLDFINGIGYSDPSTQIREEQEAHQYLFETVKSLDPYRDSYGRGEFSFLKLGDQDLVWNLAVFFKIRFMTPYSDRAHDVFWTVWSMESRSKAKIREFCAVVYFAAIAATAIIFYQNFCKVFSYHSATESEYPRKEVLSINNQRSHLKIQC